jgi:cardiolipin synthase
MVPRWLPNALSVLRIALLPAWLAFAVVERNHALDGAAVHRLALLIFAVCLGLTDLIDGQIARRFGLCTSSGAVLDAVADKLAQFSAATFLTFFASPAYTPLPLWLWLTLLVRDLLLGTGWLAAQLQKKREVSFEHRWHGKAATALLFGLVLASIAAAPQWVVTAGALVALGLIVPGTLDYLRSGWRALA